MRILQIRVVVTGLLMLLPGAVLAQTSAVNGPTQPPRVAPPTQLGERPSPAPAPAPGVPAGAAAGAPLAPGVLAGVPAPVASNARNYVVGSGDLLEIGVYGVPEFAQSTRVSNSGKIHLATLGIITASGKTVEQLEAELAGMMRDRELVRDPWVMVRVTDVRAYPVYALGEVMMPGQYQITDEMYLNDLVTLMQGFNDDATPVGFLYRRKGDTTPSDQPIIEDHGMVVVPIDFNALQTGEKPELNLKLQGGDILYVPQKRKEYVFIVGEVGTPGLLEIESREPLRLTHALARAGGPTKRAKASNIMLVRYGIDNQRTEMQLDFNAVLKGKAPDIELQFGDVLYVPNSKAKSAGLALVGILPGAAQQRVMQR